MVKTFLIDFPISILLGFVFSFYKCDIERDDPFYRFASFWWGILAEAMLVASAYHAYNLWPSWMWLHFLEPFYIAPLGWLYIFFLLYGTPYLVGYLLGQHGRRQSWWVLFNSIFMILISLYFALSEFWGRYSYLSKDSSDYIFNNDFWLMSASITFFSIVTLCILGIIISRRYYIRAIENGTLKKNLLHPGKRRTLQTIAEAIFPDEPDLRKVSAKDIPLAEIFSTHFCDMNILNRIFIRFSIEYLNSSPFFFKAIPLRFEFLSKQMQGEVLRKIYHSPNMLVKTPLWLLKMLMSMHYYEDQRVLDEIGFIGEGLGIKRPYLRWLNVPEYEQRERSVVWSVLTKTMEKTSK